jgi:hypothetical protein
MVIVLALDPRFAGSHGSDIDRNSTPLLGEVKPSTPCRKILRHVRSMNKDAS